eukprot:GILI01028054.1.p1 GENE.GILI01028054.1~~GILI01028054.1.p1  ORF type:complete len:361 (-),score=69.64 GILI01028054.1:117-1124(-)
MLSSNWKKLLQKEPTIAKKKTKKTNVDASNVKEKDAKADVVDFTSDNEVDLKQQSVDKKKKLLAPLQAPSDEIDSKAPTRIVALDCEMVGVGDKGERSALARVSLVNYYGHVLYDQFVKPLEKITDYRTEYSGVRPVHMENAISFKQAQTEVAALIKDRILVGHSLHNDLKVLLLTHPRPCIRDTSKCSLLRDKSKRPALRVLAKKHLDIQIQDGEHDSVEDAKVALALYKKVRNQWEKKASLTVRKHRLQEQKRKQKGEEAKANRKRKRGGDDDDDESDEEQEDEEFSDSDSDAGKKSKKQKKKQKKFSNGLSLEDLSKHSDIEWDSEEGELVY